jgi:hypothetical protein
MGKGKRRERAPIDQMLDGIVPHGQQPARRPHDSAGELAESFRKASKALETATRDLVALKDRFTRTRPR